MKNNPFFQEWTAPYQLPPFEDIKLEHYLPAFEAGMEQQMAEINAIINNTAKPTFENTIAALDDSGDLLDKVSLIFFNILETNASEQMQEIAEIVSEKLSTHSDNISLNADLFHKIKYVYFHHEDLNEEQSRLLEKTYKDFVRNGANLNSQKQQRFREINKNIAKLTLLFNNNVLSATNAYQLIISDKKDLAGLPEQIVATAQNEGDKNPQTKGKWVFTLQNPSLLPFLQYADNRSLRKEIWQAYMSRCNGGTFDNNHIINELINLRIERANMLGFDSHADFVLAENMARTPQAAYDLLLKIWVPALKKAKAELKTYQQKSPREKIQAWDWRYYAEKIRQEQYDIDENEIRTYFQLENVRDGIFLLANKLYGLSFHLTPKLPTYDPSAEAYEVVENNKVIGILYMDFYVRPSKGSGAWMTEFRGQHRKANGENIIPVISVVCNFPQPTATKPSLLNIDEVQTLFHECGHALHGLLSKCRYKSMAGTNVARDFVELPSQIMENWATEPEMLQLYAKHWQTNKTIDEQLIEKIKKSLTFGQGFANTELIAASLLDMDYHTLKQQKEIDPNTFEKQSMKKYKLIPEILPRYKSQYFKHIFTSAMGYSAGYYGYTWAAVLDADGFETFKNKGIFDKETAKAFRTNILEKGNSIEPSSAYLAFCGHQPNCTPLLKNKGLL